MSTEALSTNGLDDGSGLASELVVIGSMALVSGATGMAGFLHAGLSSEAAAAVSVATLSLFMMGHVTLSRGGRAKAAEPRETARPRSRKSGEPYQRVTLGLQDDPGQAASKLKIAPAEAAPLERQGAPDTASDRLSEALAQALSHQQAPSAPADERAEPAAKPEWTYRPAVEPAAAQQARVMPAFAPPPPAPAPARVAPAFELPELTPTVEETPMVPAPPAPKVAGQPMAAGAQRSQAAPPPVPAAVKQNESQVISGLLKRLAAQIETGQKPSTATATEPSPAIAWAREKFQDDGRDLETIDDAVNALQSAVGSMRASLDAAPAAAPPARDPARERLEAIADAIATERMDVMLEPILGLKQHRAQHFSVSVRLRTLTGESLTPDQVIEAAAGSGLLSMFDALRVRRASNVAARLDSNGRPGAVFSELTTESVTGDGLVRDVERGRAQGDVLPERLVLTFTQEDLRLFTPNQWRTIASLRDLGFRFAVEAITHLGMDFEGLANLGFTFVKLDSAVFLRGLPHEVGMLPASDVCRHFAGVGMAVIVTGIEDENVHARVMGFGALLGQGSLFGAPRPVKSSPPRGPAAAFA